MWSFLKAPNTKNYYKCIWKIIGYCTHLPNAINFSMAQGDHFTAAFTLYYFPFWMFFGTPSSATIFIFAIELILVFRNDLGMALTPFYLVPVYYDLENLFIPYYFLILCLNNMVIVKRARRRTISYKLCGFSVVSWNGQNYLKRANYKLNDCLNCMWLGALSLLLTTIVSINKTNLFCFQNIGWNIREIVQLFKVSRLSGIIFLILGVDFFFRLSQCSRCVLNKQ